MIPTGSLPKTAIAQLKLGFKKEDADVKVLDKSPVEELHAMMGFVNHTFWDGYVKDVGGREHTKPWTSLLTNALAMSLLIKTRLKIHSRRH